ncbi:MAG: hypothetical protein HYZ00_10885 [Candidatus Hydrogenedentes bacterium]|nr:hypothetical protein [Candidatus Hydrogenedentota bacterium]
MEPMENTHRWFATPSGKFEFCSQALEARLREAAVEVAGAGQNVQDARGKILASLGVMGGEEEDALFFPRFLLSRVMEADEAYPFQLQTYELLSLGAGNGANMPWIQENLAAHVKQGWGSWVEIHPQAAQVLGVRDGDQVWVESSRSRLQVRARLFEGMRPDIVSMPIGLGHTAGGRWAQGRGVDPSELVVSETDPGEGLGIREETRVRISLA